MSIGNGSTVDVSAINAVDDGSCIDRLIGIGVEGVPAHNAANGIGRSNRCHTDTAHQRHLVIARNAAQFRFIGSHLAGHRSGRSTCQQIGSLVGTAYATG